jgi:PIN like domain
VKFFFDNNLAIKLAHGLDQMVSPHHRVVHLRDDFLPNVEEAVWMRALAKEEDLVTITADVAISRNPHEIEAWKEAGHTVFLSQARMDSSHILGASEQVHEMLSGNHQARNALRTRRDVHCDREWENRAAQITTRSIFSV